MVVDMGDGKTLGLDGYMQRILDFSKDKVKKKWDIIIAVDGIEGAGKSLIARQLAAYCDPTFRGEQALARICFSPDEFREAILNAERFQAVIFDEAFRGLSSRSAISKVNKTITQMLMEIRQKNLFVFIVLPSFFELDKYAAIHRTVGLVHVYRGKDWQRGAFRFYDRARKKRMYIDGKKAYKYTEKANFHGKFSAKYDPVSEALYDAKKASSLKTMLEDTEKAPTISALDFRNKQRIVRMIRHMTNGAGYTQQQVADIMGCSTRHLQNMISEDSDFQNFKKKLNSEKDEKLKSVLNSSKNGSGGAEKNERVSI